MSVARAGQRETLHENFGGATWGFVSACQGFSSPECQWTQPPSTGADLGRVTEDAVGVPDILRDENPLTFTCRVSQRVDQAERRRRNVSGPELGKRQWMSAAGDLGCQWTRRANSRRFHLGDGGKDAARTVTSGDKTRLRAGRGRG